MKRIIFLFAVFFSYILHAEDNARYVDPFWGLDNRGNTFCGATLPFSMVKLGPDSYCPSRWLNTNSGYSTGNRVYGFSHTHTSGTGGAAKYGHFAVMPMTGDVNRRDFGSTVSEENASPGYYSCLLDREGVSCEFTLTPSVGVHHYRSTDGKPLSLLLDVSSLLDKGSTPQRPLVSAVRIISDTEISGYLSSEGGWNEGRPYRVWFYAVTDKPLSSCGTFREGRMSEGAREEKSVNSKDFSRKAVYLRFDASELTLKLAISFKSAEKAKSNYFAQAADKSFSRIRQEARDTWNSYLDRVDIEAGDLQKMKFYTALYRAFTMPVNRTGEMAGWRDDELYYDDYYAIWDTFRTVSPMLAIVAPEKLAEQICALVNIGLHEGFVPDARSGNCSGLTQGGTNFDIMVADALSKGIEGIDYATSLSLMLKHSSVRTPEPLRYGRDGIEEYNAKGWLGSHFRLSCSRQLEYCACDAAIAIVAYALGKDDIASDYRSRSLRWENLWNPAASSEGFKGFIAPKDSLGNWVPDYDIRQTGVWDKAFYEGSSWQYSFYVPHDIARLIELCGGRSEFVRRLDFFFENGLKNGNSAFFNIGNEPSFLTPMLYIPAGRYDRTAEIVTYIQNNCFKEGRGGLPGNDDAGAMSCWSAFNLLGIFPNPSTDSYFITSPQISKAVFHLPGGRDFTIRVHNFSERNIYVSKILLDGKRVRNHIIHHGSITSGSTLDLYMSEK